MPSSSCRLLPVALGPLEAPSTSPSAPPVALGPLEASGTSSSAPLRGRRPRRVLYPSSWSRRPPQKEAPDRARRCLLLLSALLFLQIYSEEAHTCTELQTQCQDVAALQPPEAEGGLGAAPGWTGEEPWRVQMVGGASENQLECVVA